MTNCKHLLQQTVTRLQRRNKMMSLHRVTVTEDVSKLGYTSVDLGVKVHGMYYCDLLLSQRLLVAIHHVSNEFIF